MKTNHLMALAFVAGVIVGHCNAAKAMNHGFDPDAPATKWFERLKIPPKEEVGCCGLADAYPVDRYVRLPNGDYQAWIADGSAKLYPDGTRRAPWDESVPLIIPSERVNKEIDDLDNPTDHSWLFFVPVEKLDADGHQVPADKPSVFYCFIRHPQGS